MNVASRHVPPGTKKSMIGISMSATRAFTRSFDALPIMKPMAKPMTPYFVMNVMNSSQSPLCSSFLGGSGLGARSSLIFTSSSTISLFDMYFVLECYCIILCLLGYFVIFL